MGGVFSAGGLISGMDTNTLIRQLMQLERQPVVRMNERVQTLEKQRTALRDLRTQLSSLRNLSRDFRLQTLFDRFQANAQEEGVVRPEITGTNPPPGAYSVEVVRLASATVANSSASVGAPIDPTAPLRDSGITTAIEPGAFTINGVQFSVDPESDSLDDILQAITNSAAGVVASYDSLTDRVTLTNAVSGNANTIHFGSGSSNVMSVLGLRDATQEDNAQGTTEVVSTRNLGAANPGRALEDLAFANGAVTAGAFSINGVSINVDPTDSLSAVLTRINASEAGVSASYDAANDTIRVVSTGLGSRTIAFGSANDTSNFLEVVSLNAALQSAGNDAQFSINGGPVQTRNTNEIGDAISGITLNLAGTGTTSVTVGTDDDAIVESVQDFLSQINEAVSRIGELTGQGGALRNDSSLRIVQEFMRRTPFENVPGLGGSFSNLLEIGISTGSAFSSDVIGQFELDEEAFRSALANDRAAVAAVFTNTDQTGITDRFDAYLEEVVGVNGLLNQRTRSSGMIDQTIQSYNERIRAMENRLEIRERRLREQFTQMEQMMQSFQQQGSALSGLGSTIGMF